LSTKLLTLQIVQALVGELIKFHQLSDQHAQSREAGGSLNVVLDNTSN